jgi:hypothetical protein
MGSEVGVPAAAAVLCLVVIDKPIAVVRVHLIEAETEVAPLATGHNPL